MVVLLIRIFGGINNKYKIKPTHIKTQIYTQITGGRRSSRSSTSLKG